MKTETAGQGGRERGSLTPSMGIGQVWTKNKGYNIRNRCYPLIAEELETYANTDMDDMAQALRKPLPRAEGGVNLSPGCEVIQGDCLEVLARMPAESVDMIFADPPYNLSNGGFTCHAGRAVSVNKGNWDKSQGVEKDYEFHRLWIGACKRVLKENGSIWISGTYHSIYACGFALQSEGYHILNDIAWFKPNAAPNLSCRYFTASHETLIWARKSKDAKHVFNYEFMKNGHFRNDILKAPNKQMRSVWVINTPPPREKIYGKHPTQKPLELMDRVVLASTKKGDVVLDPFMGSATTGVSAIHYGRRFIGIEKEREYITVANKRLKDAIAEEKGALFVSKN